MSVAVAQFPYWVVRNPSEVVKMRIQAGVDGYYWIGNWEAFWNLYGEEE